MSVNGYIIKPLADLTGVNLRGTCLAGADLTGANLRGANLRGASLRGANLAGADLAGADLRCAWLTGANLSDASLTGADLTCADLPYADLRGASLRDADLRGAGMFCADLTDADLRGTCLAQIPGCTPAALAYRGWKVRGAWVYGWRTARSAHVGKTHYEPGLTYDAPVLSCSRETDCHPGIYLLRDREQAESIRADVVRVRARCEDVVLLEAWRTKGIRTRRLEVMP